MPTRLEPEPVSHERPRPGRPPRWPRRPTVPQELPGGRNWEVSPDILASLEGATCLEPLVDEKTWAAGYVRSQPPPQAGPLRLEARRSLLLLGENESPRESLSRSGRAAPLAGMLLVAWSLVVLTFLLPLPDNVAPVLAGSWVFALVLCRGLEWRGVGRILLWTGGILSSLFWLFLLVTG